jgi:hypothetical protein
MAALDLLSSGSRACAVMAAAVAAFSCGRHETVGTGSAAPAGCRSHRPPHHKGTNKRKYMRCGEGDGFGISAAAARHLGRVDTDLA